VPCPLSDLLAEPWEDELDAQVAEEEDYVVGREARGLDASDHLNITYCKEKRWRRWRYQQKGGKWRRSYSQQTFWHGPWRMTEEEALADKKLMDEDSTLVNRNGAVTILHLRDEFPPEERPWIIPGDPEGRAILYNSLLCTLREAIHHPELYGTEYKTIAWYSRNVSLRFTGLFPVWRAGKLMEEPELRRLAAIQAYRTVTHLILRRPGLTD
jgi:hypothetical protein